MRVAIVAEQLMFHSPGGIGRYTAQLLAGIPRQFAGDEVVPIFARHDRQRIGAALRKAGAGAVAAEGAIVSPLPTRVMYETWTRFGWPPADWPTRGGLSGAQVVHAPSVAVPPRSGRPLVATVHDAAPALFPECFTARARSFHERALLAIAARADVVLTVSQSAAQEIAAHSPALERRLRVVPNGVTPPSLERSEVDSVLEAKGLGNRPYALWIGSLEPRKGVGTLVAAMAILARRGKTRADLVLAGYPGWLSEGIVDGADRTTLGSTLHEMGPVEDRELWALYAGAAAFAFPSIHEGFGLPVLEAMTQGTPVVASDIEVMRELTAGAARLVPAGDAGAWADALAEVFEGGAVARSLGEAGRERSKSFTLEAHLNGIHAVYEELASGR